MRDGNSEQVIVRFFTPPMAACSPEKTWKHALDTLSVRLRKRYGETIRAEFVELFTPESFNYSEIIDLIQNGENPPFVTVNGKLVQKGGKHFERVIWIELERLGLKVANGE